MLRVYLAENVGPREWDLTGLVNTLKVKFGILIAASTIESEDRETISLALRDIVLKVYQDREKSVGANMLRNLERMAFLQILDSKWKDHLYAMDTLREGISLRAYGQRDPLIEYRREAFAMFSEMVTAIEEDSVEAIFKLGLAEPREVRGVFSTVSQEYLHPEVSRFAPPKEESAISQPHGFGPARPVSKPPVQRPPAEKVGRNDPCPCGSGKKYKKCCGR